jgi:hypothetical protein
MKDIPGSESKFQKLFEPKQKQKIEYQSLLPIYQTQDWHKYNLAKRKEKLFFYELLKELCDIIPEPPQNMGRPRAKVKDLIFSLGLKLYSNYAGRKTCSDLVQAEKAGYVGQALHYNTLTEFLACPTTYDLLQKLLTITAMPLKELEDSFSIDSSGFGSYEYERWQRVRFKRGVDGRELDGLKRNYVKGHILIGTRTNCICSCEVTFGNLSDIKQAPLLIQQAKGNFNIKEVSADKAYSSYRMHQIIQSIGAMPFIAFQSRVNKESDKAPAIWNQMITYFQEHREDFLKRYHKRSNVETVFAMVKMRLGEFLKCKTYISQRNELLMKFICHNICCLVQEIFENNIKVDFKECLKSYVDSKTA